MRHGKKSSADAGLSLDNFKISKMFFEHLTRLAILSCGAILPSISNISEKNWLKKLLKNVFKVLTIDGLIQQIANILTEFIYGTIQMFG